MTSGCFQKVPESDEEFMIQQISKKVTMALKAIPQQEFQKCFQQWQHHCTAAQGEYFKGDSSQ
jgi:hypothetical protein